MTQYVQKYFFNKNTQDADQHTTGDGGQLAMKHSNGALSKEYDLRVRPMIDLIDKLRRIGLDKELGLPSIVVVGDQSAGKSSVLEAISGVQLPRGSGVVTRCPLELRMKRNMSKGPWKGKIVYTPKWDEPAVEKVVSHADDVGKLVREAQTALAGDGHTISTSLITLEVDGPDLPDLTLIDLPGIVRVNMKGQPDNTAQKIKDMIKRYVSRKETIILAVIPANVDIETSEALQMAHEVDPNHDRTLGVITKADMVDHGAEDSLMSVLLNERYHLKKGYIAVKCRGQQAIKEDRSLQQALQDEQQFFASAQHFSDIGEGMYGVPSLSARLADELAEQVQRVLPDLRDEVFKKRGETNSKLIELGEGVPKGKLEKTRFLMKILTTYSEDLNRVLEGREACPASQSRVHSSARSAFDKFGLTIRQSFLKKEQSRTFRDEVREQMRKDKGCELPRFIKYETFKSLVISLVREFDPCARRCLEDVARTTVQRMNTLAHQRLDRFPLLESKVKNLVNDLMNEAMRNAQEALTDTFTMEYLVLTQDEHFSRKMDDINRKKMEESAGKKQQPAVDYMDSYTCQEKDVETMLNVIYAYMKIALDRISDCVPMVIMQRVIVSFTNELQMKVMFLTEDDKGGLQALSEERNIMRRRDQLTASLHRLEEASKELSLFKA